MKANKCEVIFLGKYFSGCLVSERKHERELQVTKTNKEKVKEREGWRENN